MLSKLLTGDLTFKSLKPLDLACCTKQNIKAYFENSYNLNESLFTSLKDESVFYKCPDRLRLPLIFYFAHTTVVYVNKLILSGLIKERVNFNFETLFETGVDEMSWDDTENYRMGGSYKWPSVDDVVAYRRTVRRIILQLIEHTPLTLPITMASPWWGLVMAMEHERIHIETSSVLIRQLPQHMVQKPAEWTYGPLKSRTPVIENPLIHVNATEVTLGKPEEFPEFGWDNEYGETVVSVPAFKASKYDVTNREFLVFVREGGYSKKQYWTEEGWCWRQFRQANHPTFWVCDSGCTGGCGGDIRGHSHCRLPAVPEKILRNENGHNEDLEYRLRLMFDLVTLPLDWPVEVNYHEGKAFCSWKGNNYRLPSEAEHHVMRGTQIPVSDGTACDSIYNDNHNVNFNFQYGSSTPVNMYPGSDLGFHDVFGNVWEWVEDHFNGLTGFHTHWMYDDFSSPCFDGKHNVMLGGSWISTGDAASRFARFAFRRHFFQHLGFRLAQSVEVKDGRVSLPARIITSSVFVVGQGVIDNATYEEEDKYIVEKVESTNLQYTFDDDNSIKGILALEFGYRDSGAAVVAALCTHLCKELHIATDNAMHLGAGTGRAALELSKTFKHVLAVDPVGRFVDACLQLQNHGSLDSNSINVNMPQQVNLQDYHAKPDRITFKQLTWIPNEVPTHDLVLMTHMERVQNPKAWLMRVWEITKPSGIAIIGSFSGDWDQDRLQPILGLRMTCILSREITFSSPSDGLGMITVWTRE